MTILQRLKSLWLSFNFSSRAFKALLALFYFPLMLIAATDDGVRHIKGSASWTGVQRVVAIGDIHGDYEAFVEILISSKLMSKQMQWIGGNTHLVLMGDLIAGEAGSIDVLDLTIHLQIQAKAAGGRLHAILGNHDLIVASGQFNRMTRAEREAFIPNKVTGRKQTRNYLLNLFLGDGPYARWMAKRPMAVMINDKIFVHGGLDERAMGMSLEQLNLISKKWINYFQGLGPRPPLATEWVIGLNNGTFRNAEGPAFTRDFKVTKKIMKSPGERPVGVIKRKMVAQLLDQYGASQMVIGHVATPNGEILLEHPYYGEQVIITDSRISDVKRGRLSALEINNNIASVSYFDRVRAAVASSQIKTCAQLF